jgi:two-component system, OmpR family, phosphate regulon response regulator PhoB
MVSAILLVEDDTALGTSLAKELGAHGYTAHWVSNRAQALAVIPGLQADGALVDVGLPDGDGFEVAHEIKSQLGIPVLFISAHAEAEYRLKGFELGADDYIPKPFHMRELLLRLDRCLGTPAAHTKRQLSACNIDFLKQCITYADGRTVFPKTTDMALLQFLIEAAPRIVTREELDSAIFAKDRSAIPRSVDNAIMRLRGLLGADQEHVRTVRGVGYQWCG